MEILHQPGKIIASRYLIIDTLGQGGIGVTYQAEDLKNRQIVALKALSFRRMADWKVLELFEREAKILSQLTHPAIPRYLDYFQVDTNSDRNFYIAQQVAPGKSLAVLVENGWQPNESEVRNLAIQILEIIVYLHSLTPSVIHRDIKPQNIIRDTNGQVFLVDFGAVQDTYHQTVTGGSTVVGTYGYMAPEQFRGQAFLSTDLYGLGTTLLFLLTQKSPSELPQRKLQIIFRPYIRLSKEFADWLEKMLEPVIEDRFPSAEVALAVLRGEQPLSSYSVAKLSPPQESPIILKRTEEQLVIEIPSVWLRTSVSKRFGLIVLVWNGLCLSLLWGIDFFSNSFGWVLLSCEIYGLLMLFYYLLSATSPIRLTIDAKNVCLKRWLLFWCFQKVQESKSDIVEVKLSNAVLNVCLLRIGLLKYKFGSFLTEAEKHWLVKEIKLFLAERSL